MLSSIFLLLFFASFIALIVGLVRPTVFSRFIKGEITRKKIAVIFGIAMVGSFILFGVTTDSSKNNNDVAKQPTTESSSENIAPVVEKDNTSSVPTKTEPAPVATQTPTPTPAPAKAESKPTPTTSATVSQKNAVAKAKSYLNYTAFSHDGLVAQLEYDQFSHADAVYGADNSGANWSEQAARKAKAYMEYSAFSRGSLIAQLEYDKFTQAQAEYGVNAVGL